VMSLLFVFCKLVAMQVWWMEACIVMLQWGQYIWFCNIERLHLHGRPSWLCWPSTGLREYDQGDCL
jgi:hypothetical protein